MPVGHVAGVELGPGLDGAVVVAVERAVVDALGLEEDRRIIVGDGREQQTLGVVGRRGDDGFQAGDVGKDAFWRLAVRLPAEDATAEGRPHRNRHRELAR